MRVTVRRDYILSLKEEEFRRKVFDLLLDFENRLLDLEKKKKVDRQEFMSKLKTT